MFGDIYEGIIFGVYVSRTFNAYSYIVENNTLTIALLTPTGDRPAGVTGFGVVGDKNLGLIFGGQLRGVNSSTFTHFSSDATSGGTLPGARLMNSKCLTQAEYDLIPAKNPNTLYFIIPDVAEDS